MAKAVAGEAQVPFIYASGTSFNNMFMGVGILKVKALFRKLRKLALRYGGVIAFFDEADSLFAKRTEVKQANDRYGNMATNYLLQRLEQYTGVAVLTTNKDTALDEALQRRLTLHLRLEIPDVDERKRLAEAEHRE